MSIKKQVLIILKRFCKHKNNMFLNDITDKTIIIYSTVDLIILKVNIIVLDINLRACYICQLIR